MPKTKTYHHGDARSALVKEAYRQIGEGGEELFSLRACARAVGLDVSAAYRHFAAKRALVEEVGLLGFARLAEAMATQLRSAEQSGDIAPEEQLLILAHAYGTFGLEKPHLFRTMFAHPENRKRFETDARNMEGETALKILQKVIERLASHHGLPHSSIKNAEQLLWSSIHGLVVLRLQGFVPHDINKFDQLMKRQVKLTIDGLIHQSG